MVTFFAEINLPNVTLGEIQKFIRDFAEKEMRLAVKSFLDAMLSRIPIRTGFLSGSFIKVAAKYGLFHSVGSNVTKPEYYKKGSIRVRKTPESGQQFVTSPEDTFKRSGNKFEFNLNSFIEYWRINDLFPTVPGAPWLSIDAGENAFLSHLATIPSRFPDIGSILGTTTVKVTRSGVTEVVSKKLFQK